MNVTKVSIITVTFNAKDTIEQTILSILNQTWPNIEYIVVDGMSTDGTWDIICKYKEKISVLIHEKDNGLYDAMNKGIAHATGEIIGIINGDDWYESSAVADMIASMDENTDISFAKMNWLVGQEECYVTNIFNIDDIWYQMVAHPTVFIRRKIYDIYGGFNLEYPIAADYELILRFYVNSVRFKYVDKIVANFRVGGLTTRKRFECAREVRKISEEYLEKCPQKEKYQILIKEKYEKTLMDIAYNLEDSVLSKKLFKAFGNKQHELCIFGAGYFGKKVKIKLERCGYRVSCFVDNSWEKIGKTIENLKVMEPECLMYGSWNVLIVMLRWGEEVYEQIKSYNNSELRVVNLLDFIEVDDCNAQ
ncbi:Glycosyltransferase involved in cell wall bisynthesis [Lachnospiraceae bacterium KH1T2]|nr:Glycosyltransferase involved in cell wall bisynthesis [Lachnospiraceae bacterium KH1T2]